MPKLFEPLTVGRLTLPTRLLMAPMTRSRASVDGVVSPLAAEYYRQRSTAGLIISESIQPSAMGQGYILTPGLHTAAQVAGWRDVTDAVHVGEGRIFAQLTHTGRVGHPSLYPNGELPLAPSAVASGEQLFSATGMLDHPVPRQMTANDIRTTVDDFAGAARNAIDAGFDGVEIQAANGYLIHQFLADNTNLRTDSYGGRLANRIRFAVEVVTAVSDAIGADRTGVRISPGNPFNNITEVDPEPIYRRLLKVLAERGIAYVHVGEIDDRDLTRQLRAAWPGTLILNPHASPTTPDAVRAVVESGLADAVALGAMWLANPDLDARIWADGPFNTADPSTFYGGDHRGYTDYPSLVPADGSPEVGTGSA